MRKGSTIGQWMPLEIEPFLSSAVVRAMKDYQRWWYLELLLRAWQNVDRPCHLRNDADSLWMSAGAESAEFFNGTPKGSREKRSAIVIRQFVETSDGQWLSNLKQLEVYANQLGKSDVRRDAALKRWGKLKEGMQNVCNASTLDMQCNASTSLSISNPVLNSLNPEDWISKIREIGRQPDGTNRWRDPNAAAVEHCFFQQVAEKGADPTKLFEQVCRIYVATDNGQYAPKLAEVISRWEESVELWGRREKSGERANAAELQSESAIRRGFARAAGKA